MSKGTYLPPNFRELQEHLDMYIPGSAIYTPFSIGTKYQLRFELGAGFENGSQGRVDQSAHRALAIFEQLLGGRDISTLR